jgi:uncharacterized PurR-regulated membrane protein YhhQ (DUF165 family)
MKTASILNLGKYKYLYLLATIYVCIVMMSDLYESKIIHIGFLYSGSGIILFSTTFFLIGVISYVYNAKIARLVILFGILFCLIFIFSTYIAEQISTESQRYIPILKMTQNIFFATAASSFISENINANLIAVIKRKLEWLPALCLIVSIMISSLVSLVLFSTLAFGYRLGIHNLMSMTISSWMYRFFTETIITLLFSAIIIKKLQKLEGMSNE